MKRPRRTLILIILAIVPALGAPSLLHADALRDLQNQIATLLAHPVLQPALVGFEVTSLTQGDCLMSVNAEKALMPASNMKLLTTTTALELLGPGFRYCTRLLAESAPSGVVVAELNGSSIEELIKRILKPSDNELAQRTLFSLPWAAGRPQLTPMELVGETWGERGLYLASLRLADGSGLSRQNLLTPRFVVRLLTYMRQESQWGDAFAEALPIAGVDGTLAHRMRGTCAAHRVRAKTGTLTGVSSLSGYARTKGGESLVFSIIMNDFACRVSRVRRLQDQICVALVQLDRSGDLQQ